MLRFILRGKVRRPFLTDLKEKARKEEKVKECLVFLNLLIEGKIYNKITSRSINN